MSIWGKSWGISGGRGGTDTGLGWYADSEWLANEQGEIAELVTGAGPSSDFIKLNKRTPVAPILNSDTYTGTWNGHRQYATSADYDVYVFYVSRQGTYPGICYACVDHTPEVHCGYPDGYAYTWYPLPFNESYQPSALPTTVYYNYGTAGDGPSNLPTDYIWPTIEEGLAALIGIGGMTTYNKSAVTGGGLPSGYTVINGIYCDGNSSDAIDTGILASDIDQFEIVSLFSGSFSSEAWVFGSWQPDYGGHGPGVYQNLRQICWYPSGRYAIPNSDYTWFDITGDCASGIFKCNGNVLVGNGMFLHANSAYSVYLFGGNWRGDYMRTDPHMVLAYVKIVAGDVVRTYVSVKRDADGAVGMYELSTGAFYIRGHEYTGAGGTAPIPSIPPSVVGYSVTCICKWITSYGGDVYFSPVLISSNSSYTAFTKNSTAITSPTSYTYDGMTFYMLKDTSTTLDGTETIIAYVPELDLTSRGPMADMGIFYAVINAAGLGVS